MPPAFSLRMFLVSCIKSLPYFLIFGAWIVIEGGEGGLNSAVNGVPSHWSIGQRV